MARRALVIAGLSSGSGKTTLTLGLLRALHRQGADIAAAKAGPDYIDTAFLATACGKPAFNLDSVAMSDEMLLGIAERSVGETLVIEGVMGLFDGTDGGRGSSAEIAQKLGAAIILVIDCRHQAQTAAALAAGVARELPPDTHLAGVILNRVASARHEKLIAEALAARDIHLIGSVPVSADASVPSRHLGLVQSSDLASQGALETIINAATDLVEAHIDCRALLALAQPLAPARAAVLTCPITPPGQSVSMALDVAFGFHYQHMLEGWRDMGATIHTFSPLNNEAPATDADFIFLPGGYPELHLPTLSTATGFITGLQKAAKANVPIYGECGGFMTLGTRIIDSGGTAFDMAGLLDLETSFAARKLHLGYRNLLATAQLGWLGNQPITGHEFHYTQATFENGDPLFSARDMTGNVLGNMGLVKGSVAGSYAHIIC